MDFDIADLIISNIDSYGKNQERIIKYVTTHPNYSSLIYDAIKIYLDNNPKLMNQILIDIETRKLLKQVLKNKYRDNKNNIYKKKILQKIYLKVM